MSDLDGQCTCSVNRHFWVGSYRSIAGNGLYEAYPDFNVQDELIVHLLKY